MSTYNDKHVIVLDVGTRYVKCGISEERAPRCVLRWEVAELLDSRADPAAWRVYLASHLHKICFDVLHVNPRHRRFLVGEDVIGARILRETLVDVLFVDLKASSVTLVPSAVAALYATSHHTALVVDCGYKETRLLPVYKGIPMLYYYSSVSVAAASCCDHLTESFTCVDTPKLRLFQAEDVLERACFVRPLQDRLMEVANASLTLHGSQPLVVRVRVPANTRSDVCEHLFIGSEKSGGGSIISCLQEQLKKLPIDVRTAMIENVLVLGGTSMLPGFCARLQEELVASLRVDKQHQQLSDRVTLVRPLFPSNVLSWVGASIFAATDAAKDATISANEYAASGTRSLPDWMSIAETEI